jgi:DHA2 family methylenomycin A resistance protein-like MFS transporter
MPAIPAIPARPVDPVGPSAAFTAALLGFFVVTLDASIVNVALPAIGRDLGGGIAGLQWVVDGYVLVFAALLLSAGSLSDRIGARRAFGTGLAVFVASSLACGLAASLSGLVAARLVQGAGAAMMMPASLALIREAYADPVKRGRAIALWTIGGSVAAAAGPVAGGALSLVSWRLIFFVNLPVGLLALAVLTAAARSPQRPAPFDVIGQVAAVVAMGGLTFAVIQAGSDGFAAPPVLTAFALAVAGAAAFLLSQRFGRHPMVPVDLLRLRTVVIASGTGFAFIGGFSGLVFVYSLYLQDQRGLSPLATGLTFVPMTLLSGFAGLPAARLAERFGPRVPIIGGLAFMGASLIALAALPAAVPVWVAALVMIPVGVCGPLAIAPTTALLLESVPAHRSGVASGVFNTSRQLGGALAVAVFGALLAHRAQFERGLRESLLIAAALALTAGAANLLTQPAQRQADAHPADRDRGTTLAECG